MKKIINYFKSWGIDKWTHFGIGGLICALLTIIFIFTSSSVTISWPLLFAAIPGAMIVGIISVIKELKDSTGFSTPDIIAALIGCAIVEVTLIIGIIVGALIV